MNPHRAPTEQAAAEFARQWKAEQKAKLNAAWRSEAILALKLLGFAASIICAAVSIIMIGGMGK